VGLKGIRLKRAVPRFLLKGGIFSGVKQMAHGVLCQGKKGGKLKRVWGNKFGDKRGFWANRGLFNLLSQRGTCFIG